MKRLASRVIPLSFAIAATAPAMVQAQRWPEASVQLGVGISSLSGKGALGAIIDASRSWGPITGVIGAEMRVANRDGNSSRNPTYDPFSGTFKCGGQPVSSNSGMCTADLVAQVGPTAELGVAIAPALPLLFTVGYRHASVSEVFYSATVFGTTSRDGMGWTLRVAAGKKVTLFTFGLLFDFPQPY